MKLSNCSGNIAATLYSVSVPLYTYGTNISHVEMFSPLQIRICIPAAELTVGRKFAETDTVCYTNLYRHVNVELELWPSNSFSGNNCFEFSVLVIL